MQDTVSTIYLEAVRKIARSLRVSNGVKEMAFGNWAWRGINDGYGASDSKPF